MTPGELSVLLQSAGVLHRHHAAVLHLVLKADGGKKEIFWIFIVLGNLFGSERSALAWLERSVDSSSGLCMCIHIQSSM